LQYTIDAESAGKYALAFRVKLIEGSAEIQPEINDMKQLSKKVLNDSGWFTFRYGKINLKKGTNRLRIHFSGEGLEIGSVEIK
jgi:hypothetical protein